ncbi:MAG: hypothetical protein NVSMB46_09720 [Candidatus Saccharimonadales bacterium]
MYRKQYELGNEIPVGYIEAKDIGIDINHKDYKEQFDRYKKLLRL